MEPYVTVATFMLPTELAVARGLLESEGIDCRTLDEFTVQVHNLYSQAIGGVKLQVPAEEAEHARALLREGGFLFDAAVPEEDHTWQRFLEWTGRVPLLRRLELPMARLMVLVALLLALVLVPLGLASMPTVADLLTQGEWCVDRVVHDGQDMEPHQMAYQEDLLTLELVYPDCRETLWFRSTGEVWLPAYGTRRQQGQWAVARGGLWIQLADGTSGIYEGPFAVSVNEHYLTLRSQRTTIHCTKHRYGWLF
jgi:hypothetical protein